MDDRVQSIADQKDIKSLATGATVATMGHRFPDVAVEAEALREVGIKVKYLGGLAKEEALAQARGVEGVLLGVSFALDAAALRTLKRCRVIVRYGVGVDNVDVEAARELGIAVCNVPHYAVEEVASHTIALLLFFARRLDVWERAFRAGQWGSALPKVKLPRLSKSTLGVIGAGRIGQAVIARAKPFWGQILVFDPMLDDAEVAKLGGSAASLDELLAQSEFVTLHIPSTPTTQGLLSAERLRLMPSGAVVVNCSRGDVIDEEALAQEISAGRIAGAGLDVFAEEPPRMDGIASLSSVWPTPHVAWLSTESIRDLRRMAAEEAGRILMGRQPQSPVVLPGS
jgi:D-3-phosphoglycerate dehydrogenase